MIPGAAFTPRVITPVAISRVHSAIRLGGLVLGLVTVMVLMPLVLPLGVFVLAGALRWTGMAAGEQLQLLKPWWPMAVIVLAVHAATASMAAGGLVVGGVYSGLITLGRIMLCLGLMSFFLRVTSLEETIDAVHYWCKPLQALGVQTRHLGLVLAVALGTAPVVLEEGKRIRAVVRMRRATGDPAGAPSRLTIWRGSLLDWGHILVPMMESLGRRADTLSLSLANRMPNIRAHEDPVPGPGLGSLLLLVIWLMGIFLLVLKPQVGGWV
jgi:energy-coupling factor transporter transmembrane protein EcfT